MDYYLLFVICYLSIIYVIYKRTGKKKFINDYYLKLLLFLLSYFVLFFHPQHFFLIFLHIFSSHSFLFLSFSYFCFFSYFYYYSYFYSYFDFFYSHSSLGMSLSENSIKWCPSVLNQKKCKLLSEML